MGVSRQAISKWESDAALPDIEKLIALSRLFDISVGWLLGVEEQPQPQPEAPQLTEEMLRKIEEVVRRCQPRKKRLSGGKRICIGILAAAALWAAADLASDWRDTRLEVAYLGAQLRNNNEQNASILNKLNRLDDRIDSINTSVKEAAASLASYEFRIIPNMEEQYARVELTAFPKNWNEDWTATLNVRYNGALSLTQECHWDGSALNAAVKLNFVDGLEYWLVFTYPDGNQEQIPLEDQTARDLYSSFSILCDAIVEVSGYHRTSMYSDYARFTVDIIDLYLCRPAPEEHPEDWFWTRTDYVLYRTRNDVRTILETQPILNPEEDANIQECWISQSPSFTIEEPQEGDIYELWVMLELANGLSLEECVGSRIFRNGDLEIPE